MRVEKSRDNLLDIPTLPRLVLQKISQPGQNSDKSSLETAAW